jgi:phosphatidylglycerol:prolipoprotein diacylglycerol transferase
MIPYAHLPDVLLVPAQLLGDKWPTADVALHPFGLLVAAGIWLGIALTLLDCRKRHLSIGAVESYLLWLLAFGFLGGHVFDLLFYCPQCVVREPQCLLRIWQGQSSLGGFIGAGLGSFAWRWRAGISAGPYAEAVSSSFPAAWFLGRVGCALVHDHPGRLSSAWWAVAYPAGARLDMGLLEAGLTLPLALAFLWLRRKARPPGFFLGVMCTYYAPLRFALDFARARDVAAADARYLQLTPAQWGCLGLFAVGMWSLAGVRSRVARTAGG